MKRKPTAKRTRRAGSTPALVIPVREVNALRRKIRTARRFAQYRSLLGDPLVSAVVQTESLLTAVLADLGRYTGKAAIIALPAWARKR